MSLRIRKGNTIRTALGSYERALETSEHIYYVNYKESDENGSVKMYDRKMELVSDNYFAYGSLMEDIEEERYTWIAKKLKKCLVVSN